MIRHWYDQHLNHVMPPSLKEALVITPREVDLVKRLGKVPQKKRKRKARGGSEGAGVSATA
jgi:hypothetical protein